MQDIAVCRRTRDCLQQPRLDGRRRRTPARGREIVIEDTLRTMNVWLAITAVVTLVQVLIGIAIVVGGYLVYRR